MSFPAGLLWHAARSAHAVLDRDVHGPGSLVPLDAVPPRHGTGDERGHRPRGGRDRGGAAARGGAGAATPAGAGVHGAGGVRVHARRRARAGRLGDLAAPLRRRRRRALRDRRHRRRRGHRAAADAASRLTMPVAEYGRLDALGLADLVRRREVTPAELLEEAIARAERVNPRVNAIVTPLYDQARRDAAALVPSTGAFHGVPLLLKDLDAAVAGVPLTA